MDSSRRHYRQHMQPAEFSSFTYKMKETDLQLAVDEHSFTPHLVAFVEKRVLYYRTLLEQYISRQPLFGTTLEPYVVGADAPPMALAMTQAGNLASVGPMAAVAGAFAEFVGRDLLSSVEQVIVENGGDIFLQVKEKATVAVYAGDSPLSNRIIVELAPQAFSFGVCTSSGTVGPSLSFGRADAAMIIAPSTMLADAVATATANRVQTPADLEPALTFARQIPGVMGALIIKDDKLVVWGQLKLLPA
ncbi:MAG: UPF0280 family protein [Firmicutes bacterium]|nr:UPF0280 family protein [Bacillota bacterium]